MAPLTDRDRRETLEWLDAMGVTFTSRRLPLEAIVPAHIRLGDFWAIAWSFDALATALAAHASPLGREDCDGCDNPDGLPVKRVELPDGSEEWLCSDCRADR